MRQGPVRVEEEEGAAGGPEVRAAGRAGTRTLVLLNPEAGKGEDQGEWRAALDGLRDVEVRESRDEADARERVRGAIDDGVERIVAAGGDGTVSLVVDAVAAADGLDRVQVGILPLGTANDYARSLELPAEPETAVDVLRRGRTRRVDLGRVEGPTSRHLVNVSVGGFGGRVGERVASETKRRWGPLAYFEAAAEQITHLERYDLHARLDEEELELQAVHVIVANGTRTGGNIPVAPNARLDDGLLDVILVPALELPQLLALIPTFLAGQHTDDERLVVRRVEGAAFRSDPPMPFGVDGEPIGDSPVDFRVLAGALEVIC